MEKSLSLPAQLKREFGGREIDIRTYSPLTLAYIGDSVYDVMIRTLAVGRGNRGANELHKAVVRLVNAKTQAAMIEALSEDLSEAEMTVYKRGRNAKSNTMAKNASIIDYRKATGMEALIGYLYLQDRTDRIIELLKIGLHKLEMRI